MREINEISIHCADAFGWNVESMRKDHIEHRNWSDIGYHLVIGNGYKSFSAFKNNKYNEDDDGFVYTGRDIEKIPAAVYKHNRKMIAICLIGKNVFSEKQMEKLTILVGNLMKKYNIPINNVKGHYEYDTANGKTCPNFNMNLYRNQLKALDWIGNIL